MTRQLVQEVTEVNDGTADWLEQEIKDASHLYKWDQTVTDSVVEMARDNMHLRQLLIVGQLQNALKDR